MQPGANRYVGPMFSEGGLATATITEKLSPKNDRIIGAVLKGEVSDAGIIVSLITN